MVESVRPMTVGFLLFLASPPHSGVTPGKFIVFMYPPVFCSIIFFWSLILLKGRYIEDVITTMFKVDSKMYRKWKW